MFYDKFSELCKKKGVSCKRAAIEIGLSNSISAKWKRTGATPNGDTLSKLAAYFGVSVSHLLGEEEQKETPASEEEILRNEREKQFAELYEKLTPEQQEFVLAQLRGLAKSQGS